MARPLFVVAALFVSFHAMAGELPTDPDGETANTEQGFWRRDNLLGDWGGLRSRLGQVGVDFNLQDTDGIWANLAGGLRRGDVYNGATTLGASIDLERAIGWEGARAFVSAEWLRGHSPTRDLVGSLQQVNQLDIGRGGLIDLWFEQDLMQHRLSVRVGQERPDEEFLLSPYGQVLINSTFGWPGLIDADIPTHNASPMIRVAYNLADRIRLATGVFKGTGSDNRSALVIGEMQYTNGLSSYRFGGWYQTGSFPDQIFETWMHQGGYGIYASIDQMVWRQPDTGDQGIALFGRALGGSTLTNFQIDGGINWKGPIPGREQDTIAAGASYLRFSGKALQQSAMAAEEGAPRPLPRAEIVLEVTYQAQVTGWLQVQPDLQYIIYPAGQLTSEGHLPHNAAFVGVQATISF